MVSSKIKTLLARCKKPKMFIVGVFSTKAQCLKINDSELELTEALTSAIFFVDKSLNLKDLSSQQKASKVDQGCLCSAIERFYF